MENFDWTTFTRKIAIKAKLSDIYDAWVKASAIERWFLKEAIYFDKKNNPIDKDARVKEGFSYKWTWFLYDGMEQGKITAANGKDFIQFTFEGECLVDVKLYEQDNAVIVELTQKNIPTDDLSKKNIRLGCHAGWSFYLVNLKSVSESGLDLRNKNKAFGQMINN